MIDAEKTMLLGRIKSLREEIDELEAMINAATNEEEKKEIKEEKNKKEEEKKSKEEELKEKMQKEIEKFNSNSDKLKKGIEKVKASLILEISVENLDVTEALSGLTDELKGFETEAKTLISDIEAFKEEIKTEDLSISIKDIKARVKEFKSRIVTLKKEQIIKYNNRVEYVNKNIRELKEKLVVNTEAYEYFSQIEELTVCSATVTDWRHTSYLEQLSYTKLIEIDHKVKEVENKLEIMKTLTEEFEKGIEFINEKVFELQVVIVDDMSEEDLLDAKIKFDNLFDLLFVFGTKLETAKAEKKITEEEIRMLSDKYQAAMFAYLSFQKTLTAQLKNEETEYDKMSKSVDNLGMEVNDFGFKVDSLYGHVDGAINPMFDKETTALNEKYTNLKDEIEKAYVNKTIDENQYKSLNDRMAYVDTKLNETRLKLQDSKMYILPEDQIFKFLNNKVDGIEKTIEELDKTLEQMPKPIKDKATRKAIDAIFKRLEAEIKQLEKQLEVHKDTDPEKYNETKERLNGSKKKLEALGKKYRRKCPLLVRAVKSAKHFFKKYKKALLIIAGLVSFAMMAHTILIPSIMYGNALMANANPMLMPFIRPMNKLLGGLIGATQNPAGLWLMGNGAVINAGTASASLLKGLALSGIGTAALVAPVVISTKKLIEKMNMSELKQKLADAKEKLSEKTDALKDKLRNNKSNKIAKKEMTSDIKVLMDDFKNSGLTVEEYCKQNNIDGMLADILFAYDEEVKKNREMLENKKGRGGK